MNTYRVVLHNPAGNPEETEVRYIYADSQIDAEAQSQEIVDNHIFNDVTLISVNLIDPQEFYHEESSITIPE